jgi:hypothetical protein
MAVTNFPTLLPPAVPLLPVLLFRASEPDDPYDALEAFPPALLLLPLELRLLGLLAADDDFILEQKCAYEDVPIYNMTRTNLQ